MVSLGTYSSVRQSLCCETEMVLYKNLCLSTNVMLI